jgi:hypothetical protein
MTSVLELGDAARPFTSKSLKEAEGAELRKRLDDLVDRLYDESHLANADLRSLRALTVLEQVGTKEARAKIGELTKGLPDARLTREAKRAVERAAVLQKAGHAE